MRPVSLIIFFFFEAGILILILYYRFVSKPGTNNRLEDFMNKDSFGVRLFMTSLGLGTTFYWGWIAKYVHHMSIYIALASPSGATAEQSILVEPYSHPIMALFSRDTWQHLLTGIVMLMAVLSEVLIITLSAVPFTTATAYQAFEISVYMSVAILTLMILTLPAVLYWQTRDKSLEMEQSPQCIADTLALVPDGRGWNALSMMSGKERNRVVKGWELRYGLRRVNNDWQIVTLRNENTS
jgi:hypothetical protein